MQVINRAGLGSGAGTGWAPCAVADLLTNHDRQLLEIGSSGTVSTRALAGVLQCAQGTVSRRMRRLRTRVKSPMVQMIARHGGALPADLREVGIRVFVRGEPRKHVARQMSLSRTHMTRLLDELRGWAHVQARVDREST